MIYIQTLYKYLLITLIYIVSIGCSDKSQIKESDLNIIDQAKIQISNLDRQIQLKSRSDDLYFKRGKLKLFIGERKEAILDINKAIQLNKYKPDYFFFRASAKDDIGDYRGAVMDYDLYIDLSEPNERVYFLQAESLIKIGEYSYFWDVLAKGFKMIETKRIVTYSTSLTSKKIKHGK